MKYAKLHDGQMLAFDPATPDEAIAAHVKKRIGSQSSGDMASAALAQLSQLAGHLSQSGQAGASAHQNGVAALNMAAQACQAMCNAMKAMQDQHAQDIEKLIASHKSDISRLVSAITAPKKIVRDKNGKPVGVETA